MFCGWWPCEVHVMNQWRAGTVRPLEGRIASLFSSSGMCLTLPKAQWTRKSKGSQPWDPRPGFGRNQVLEVNQSGEQTA